MKTIQLNQNISEKQPCICKRDRERSYDKANGTKCEKLVNLYGGYTVLFTTYTFPVSLKLFQNKKQRGEPYKFSST